MMMTTSASTKYLRIDKIVARMNSTHEMIQLRAMQSFNDALHSFDEALIDLTISQGIVPRCTEFLSSDHSPFHQMWASQILTRVARKSLERTIIIINHGVIPKLVELLKSPDPWVARYAVRALGRIASVDPDTRDQVLEVNCMPLLLNLVKNVTPVGFTIDISWAIWNLFRHKSPSPPFEILKMTLPALNHLITEQDTQIVSFTCLTLVNITDGEKDEIQAVIDSGIVPKLVVLLTSSETMILTPALKAVGNITTGNCTQTDAILDAGVLTNLRRLLEHHKPDIVEKATWILGNIIAGDERQIQSVIDAGILPLLVKVLAEGEPKARKEAARAISNLVSGGSDAQFLQLVKQGVLAPFCHLLRVKDDSTPVRVLDCLTNAVDGLGVMDQGMEKSCMKPEDC